ncbi:hypothetical protein M9Y10_026286 [Tritrichomonas musculus]|uniref:IQ calmodulin-binding motif family protein n=1 Tax=Tritrichomonas musculus TaxID=1915356 RepID=A0ABR2H763_9EUKA
MISEVTQPSFIKYDSKNDIEIHPVTEREERLIEKYFKQCYIIRATSYAETTTMAKRKRFFGMLNYASQNLTLAEVTRKNRMKEATGEKPGVDPAFSSNGAFGLSYSTLTQKRSSRKINLERFASHGICNNGIFGFSQMASFYNDRPTTNQLPNFYESNIKTRRPSTSLSRTPYSTNQRCSDSAHLVITKMTKPEHCQSFVNMAEEYSDIWQDLAKVIDRSGKFTNSNPKRTYGCLQNSQSITDNAPNPFLTMNKIPNDSRIRKRDVDLDATSPRRLNYSLRIDDSTLRNSYRTDSRWSPRIKKLTS